jgi:hypothetical protein
MIELMDILKLFILYAGMGTVLELWFRALRRRSTKPRVPFIMPLFYGMAALPFYAYLQQDWPLLLKVPLYGLTIIGAEYLFGRLYLAISGSYPWRYESGLQLEHLIRLDYFPLWCGLGYLFEGIGRFYL